jgi:nitrogen fixation/metabolism regulation signal transduction histidine kinase
MDEAIPGGESGWYPRELAGLTHSLKTPLAVLRATLSEPGHGIGLAVVSDLVASHQGELTLSRADSGGAQLDIVLPAA